MKEQGSEERGREGEETEKTDDCGKKIKEK
jgi:hypothetical protein